MLGFHDILLNYTISVQPFLLLYSLKMAHVLQKHIAVLIQKTAVLD